jgi:hypothetical protein
MPVGLDLDGNGLDIRSIERGKGPFDWDGDGVRDATDWVGHRDGLLVLDIGNDGKIDQKREIAFTDWAPGSTGDMEALRMAFDTNGDGVLSAADARWSEFRVWQDKNQNGITDKKELRTLDEWGITSIDLNPTPTKPGDPHADIITGTSHFTWADGSKGIAGDMVFSSTPSTPLVDGVPQVTTPTNGPVYRLESTAADEVLNGSNGRDTFVFREGFGNDVICVFQGGLGLIDVIEFDRAVVASTDAVMAAARQEDEDVVITLEAGTITLRKTSLTALHADDFVFV